MFHVPSNECQRFFRPALSSIIFIMITFARYSLQIQFRTALSNIIFITITIARYSVMVRCWNANPKNRPTFEELSDELRQMRTTVTVSIKSFKIT